jgi:hypothetical protein
VTKKLKIEERRLKIKQAAFPLIKGGQGVVKRAVQYSIVNIQSSIRVTFVTLNEVKDLYIDKRFFASLRMTRINWNLLKSEIRIP